MSYLKFNQEDLVNLEYSLSKEVVLANGTGGYSNTTLVGCNTRKYHGLFVLPIENFSGVNHLLLSSVDETLIQQGKEFNLGIRRYGKIYEPRGHKYIISFEFDKEAITEYRVGGMLFRKSMIFVKGKEQLLIKYTLVKENTTAKHTSQQTTQLRLKPFLAFREVHSLTQENPTADTNYSLVNNGCGYKMYEGFPNLYLQISKENEYFHTPTWYKDVVYTDELRRGFDYVEDLFVPGVFEIPITLGESVILSVSTSEVSSPKGLKALYEREVKKRESRKDYESCLKIGAKDFIVKTPKGQEIISGYSWNSKGLRETLVALPGLTIFNDGDVEMFDKILKTTLKVYSNQLYEGSRQAEAPLWLFWALQQYSDYTGCREEVWNKYKSVLKKVVDSYILGGRMGVHLNRDNGMLWTKMHGVALSWMNAYGSDGLPVAERGGFQVETNALWYNALCYLIENETKYGRGGKVVYGWKELKEKIENNFYNMFWVEERAHLADYVDEHGKNPFTRPNQQFACALEYSPISEEVQANVLRSIYKELLTTHGIRTLSPKNPLYKGVYEGNQHQRDLAHHQGCTRPWLIAFYIDACLKLFGDPFLYEAQELVDAYEADMKIHGIGSIAELYNGDPRYVPHGAICHAGAVAEVIRARKIIENYKNR